MNKKIRNKLKKKLPKYVLGTMKSVDLGYQPGRGIGSARFETEENISLDPETKALRESIVPNAIGKIGQYGTQVANNIKEGPVFGTKEAPAATSAVNSVASKTTSTLSPYIAAPTTTPTVPIYNWNTGGWSGLNNGGLTAAQNAAIDAAANEAVSSWGSIQSQLTGELAKQGSKTGLKTAINTAGKVASVIGSAYGLYDMGSQIANAGSHRTGSEMMSNVGKSYTTSDYGNTSMNYNGVNAAQELAYERANKRAKQTNFFLTSTGTGASIGSLFPGWGTAIGAGIGALVGGVGSLLGLGDNEDEVKREIALTNDNFANFNRQQDAVRKSQDVASEFNSRMGYAKCGKSSGGPMKKYKQGKEDIGVLQGPNGYAVGKPTSMLAPGEYTYDPVNMTGDKVTGKGHEDTVPSYIEPNDQNIVFSDVLKIGNKSIAKHAAPMIKEMEKLNKIITQASQAEGLQEGQQQLQISQAKQRQQELNEQLVQLSELQNVQRDMKQYKCGKKPGYDLGKWAEYGLTALPHLTSLISNRNSYNRAKHADTFAPSTYVENTAGRQALDELASLRFDPSQYLTDAQRAYNQANWQVNRSAGYGAGAQAIMRNANLQSYLNSLGQIRTKEQEANNSYKAAYADALAKYGAAEQAALTQDNIQRFNWRQQQNAAKEYYMDTYRKGGLTSLADLASDVMKVNQFNRAQDYQNNMLDLYRTQVNADVAKTMQDIYNQVNANRDAYNSSRQSSGEEYISTPLSSIKFNTNEKDIQTLSKFLNENMESGHEDGGALNYGRWLGNRLKHKDPNAKIEDLDLIPANMFKAWIKSTGHGPVFKCGKSAYQDGKPGYTLSNYVNSSGSGESVLSNPFFPTERSTKHITTEGDTTYTNAATPPVGLIETILGSSGVMRKKGEPASPEYLKAKAYHEQMLRNVPQNSNKSYLQMLKEMFGFKCGKPAYKCGKSGKRKRC